jgi:hypothetical protein
MGFVEEMKWWQWIAVSLLIGALLAYSNSSIDLPVVHRSMATSNFEDMLLRPPLGDTQRPWVTNITVYPQQMIDHGETQVPMQMLTFNCIVFQEDHPELAKAEPFAMLVPIPYVPIPRGRPRPDRPYPGITVHVGQEGDTLQSLTTQYYGKDTPAGKRAIIAANPVLRDAESWASMKIELGRDYSIPWDPNANPPHTIQDFLKSAVDAGIAVKYTYAWWDSTKYAYEIWMGGSFLVLGLIFPALIRMMLRGGLGRAEKSEFELRKYRPAAIAAKAVAKGPSAMDMQQLRELEAQMTATLKAGATEEADETQTAASSTPAPAAAPKKLAAGPLETAAQQKQEEDKNYGGEFYPVERPVDKKKDK